MNAKDIVSGILQHAIAQIKTDTGATWVYDDIKVNYVRYETETGAQRIVVDSFYSTNNNHVLRVYVYINEGTFTERIHSDQYTANNEPYDMFVLVTSLRSTDFNDIKRLLLKYDLFDTVIDPMTTASCELGNLLLSPTSLPVGTLTLPSGGSLIGGRLVVGSTWYFTRSDYTTMQTNFSQMTMSGPALPSTATAATGTYTPTYIGYTGCVVGTKMYFSRTSSAISWLDTATSNGHSSTAGGIPKLMRADENGKIWLMAENSGTYTLFEVDPITLTRTTRTRSGDSLDGTITSNGGFCANGYLYVATNRGMYRIVTATGVTELLTDSWLHPFLGHTNSTFLRSIKPHSSGDIMGILGAAGLGSKYFVRMSPTGDVVGSIVALPNTIDRDVVPVELLATTIVLMSTNTTGATVVEVNLDSYMPHTYTTGTGSPTLPSHAFLALDGRVYLPSSVSGQLLYVERCPNSVPITAAEQARIVSHELNCY